MLYKMADLAGFLNISYSNSFYFTNANNNDILIYPETSNQIIRLGITSNSTSLLDISSNAVFINSANFGIGLSNPAYKLDIVGSMRIYNSNPDIILQCSNNTLSNAGSILFQNSAGNYTSRIGRRNATNNANLVFSTGLSGDYETLTDVMTITNTGNVGINTSNPTTRLQIGGQGDSNTDEIMQIVSQRYAGMIIYGDSNNLGSEPGGAYLRFNTDGGAADTILGQCQISNLDPSGRTYSNVISNSFLIGGKSFVETMQFGTNSNVRMTITNAGNIGMGTINPACALDIVGGLQVSSNIITPGLTNRIWDYSGLISDTSSKPGYVSTSYITGCNITVSSNTAFSNINTEGSIYLPGIVGNYIKSIQSSSTPLTDFTIESWIYLNSTPNSANGQLPYLIGNMDLGNGNASWTFGIDPSNKLSFYGWTGSANLITGSTISLSNWTHIAACYTASTRSIQLFLNGSIQTLTLSGANTSGNGTTTGTSTIGYSNLINYPLVIGQFGSNSMNAYISNLRFVNSVLYKSSFTPSKYPLQVYNSNTQLLLRAPLYNPLVNTNAIHTYDSLRAHCLPTDALIYADCYGTNLPNLSTTPPLFDSNLTKSIIFNPTNSNYLSFPAQTFNIATKGFTAICKLMTTSNYSGAIFIASNSTNNQISLYQTNGVNNGFLMYNGSTQVNNGFINGSTSLNTINTVICRYDPYTNLGTVTTFINGSNAASNINWNASIGTDRVLTSINIGNYTGPPYLNGNIYNLAVYNRALTDKEILDASATLMQESSLPNKSIVEIGNANGKPALTVQQDGSLQIAGPITTTNNQSYAPIDFGVSNLSIPGYISGNVPAVAISPFNNANEGSLYINNSNSSNFISIVNFTKNTWNTSGGFTMETWVNYLNFSNVVSNTVVPTTFGNGLSALGINSSSNLSFCYNNGSYVPISGSTYMQSNTWYHIAMTYDMSYIRIFLNGVIQNSNVISGTVIAGTNINLGATNSIYLGSAYITNARVVYGSALYTSNFVPPTGPLNPASTGTTAILLRVPQNPGKVLIPKIGGTTQVQAYPPAAMTGYVTNIQNTSYGAGTYIASASTDVSGNGRYAWSAFNKTINTHWAGGGTYNTTSGLYIGSVSMIDASGTSYIGEWLQLQLPISINISSFSIQASVNPLRSPNSFTLFGSTDNNTWYSLYNQSTSANWTAGESRTYFLTTNKSYNYYRIISTSIFISSETLTSIEELILYGIQESINITPDGQVGLGVTNPKQQLEVAGNAMIYGNISANNLGMFRNRIINGDMRINQRGVTGSNIGIATKYFLQDRWDSEASISTGQITLSNITLTTSDTPYQYGIQNSFRSIATIACSSYNYILPVQSIEGYNIQDFNWGTSFSQPITISMWLRTSMVSGNNICLTLRNDALSYSYNTNINVVGSNQWQYVNTTINAPPNGSVWNNSNGRGIYMSIGGYQSSSLQSTSNTWVNANNLGTTTTTNLWATVNNFVEFTGVQLEKGTIATPFEFRPYALELQLCQRYYYPLILSTFTSNQWPNNIIGSGLVWNANNTNFWFNIPTPLRTTPTVSAANSSNLVLAVSSTYGMQFPSASYSNITTNVNYYNNTNVGVRIGGGYTLSSPFNVPVFLYCQNSSNALIFDAEL